MYIVHLCVHVHLYVNSLQYDQYNAHIHVHIHFLSSYMYNVVLTTDWPVCQGGIQQTRIELHCLSSSVGILWQLPRTVCTQDVCSVFGV